MADGILEFGEFQLDCVRFELRRKGSPLRLERKPLELLILLASSGGRLVTRDEIAQHLWPSEVFVDTEHGINTAIRKIRQTLRENPEHPRFLITFTGKGYRFIGVTPQPQPAPAAQDHAPEPPIPQLVLPDRPAEPPLGESAARIGRRHARGTRPVWIVAGSMLAASITIAALATLGARRVHGHSPVLRINPAAIDAYQHGLFLWFSDHQEASGEYFLKATELAPNYAAAWAGLSTYYGAQIVRGQLDPRQDLPLVDAAAHRADQLDDNLPEAHLALAGSDWEVNWDYPSALKELDRAIQLDPKLTEAHHLRAKLLAHLNRQDEALAEQRLAMQINPFERLSGLGRDLVLARRYDDAIAETHARLEGASNGRLWRILSDAFAAKGMQKESEQAREQYLTMSGNSKAADAVHRAFAHGGRREVLLWTLADLKSQSQNHYVSPYNFAVNYAELGENQQALDALDETVRQHSPMIFDIQNNYSFDGLHAEPRYRAIVHRIGLPPAWQNPPARTR